MQIYDFLSFVNISKVCLWMICRLTDDMFRLSPSPGCGRIHHLKGNSVMFLSKNIRDPYIYIYIAFNALNHLLCNYAQVKNADLKPHHLHSTISWDGGRITTKLMDSFKDRKRASTRKENEILMATQSEVLRYIRNHVTNMLYEAFLARLWRVTILNWKNVHPHCHKWKKQRPFPVMTKAEIRSNGTEKSRILFSAFGAPDSCLPLWFKKSVLRVRVCHETTCCRTLS